jgi:hypothetical protein
MKGRKEKKRKQDTSLLFLRSVLRWYTNLLSYIYTHTPISASMLKERHTTTVESVVFSCSLIKWYMCKARANALNSFYWIDSIDEKNTAEDSKIYFTFL